MTQLDDEGAAIERCKSGDREAFGAIVQKYMKPAYYVALGYVGTPDDALDISQDAFVNALRHIKRRDLFVLQYFRDYWYQDMADRLWIPIGTVMSRLCSLGRALRKELERLVFRY